MPGPAKMRTSVDTLTASVALVNSSTDTFQDRRMTNCDAVPDGPGMMFDTAEDASRATSERLKDRPGVSTV